MEHYRGTIEMLWHILHTPKEEQDQYTQTYCTLLSNEALATVGAPPRFES